MLSFQFVLFFSFEFLLVSSASFSDIRDIAITYILSKKAESETITTTTLNLESDSALVISYNDAVLSEPNAATLSNAEIVENEVITTIVNLAINATLRFE